MACYTDLITPDKSIPSRLGLYANGLPGVTLSLFDNLTKDEQEDYLEFWDDIYQRSWDNFVNDVQALLADKFHIDLKILSRETSSFLDAENEADELAGALISLDLSKYARTHIVSVEVDVIGFTLPQNLEVIETGETFLGVNDEGGLNLRGIAFGDNKFIAVSEAGMVISEDFGETWELTGPTSTGWYNITYANGYWVAVSTNENTDEVIAVSTDGRAWQINATGIASGGEDSGTNFWKAVAYGNGRFVVVGGRSSGGATRVIYSTDNGETWTPGTAIGTEAWLDVAFGDGKFVAISNDNIMYSFDGATWTQSDTIPATTAIKAITYGDGTWVIVGDNLVLTSPDGNTWTSRTPADDSQLLDVIYANGLFMALSYDTAALDTTPFKTSPDGITWTARAAADIEGFVTIALAHGGGYVVGVSDFGLYNHTTGLYDPSKMVVRSSDGSIVDINFYEENSSGDLLHTVTSQVSEGKNVIDVDQYFEVDDLFVSIDPTKYRFNKTENKYYANMSYSSDKLSCTFPCAFGEGSVSQVNGGGLNVTYNVHCSIEKVVCENINLFRMALWYRIGVELMIERRLSDRFNRFTTLTTERAEELMTVYHGEYDKLIKNSTRNLSMREDPVCFTCASIVDSSTVLP